MNPVLDISNYQTGITHVDWLGIRRHFSGIGIKLTEGHTLIDRTAKDHFDNAKEVGVPFTAYHFARPNANSPKVEADHFADTHLQIIGRKSPWIPTLDIEIPAKINLDLWVREFVHQIENRLRVIPQIYTFSSYLNNFKKPHGNGLWVANYDRNTGTLHPIGSVHPWLHWRLHQYTSKGRTPYVHGYVDLSMFRDQANLLGIRWKDIAV